MKRARRALSGLDDDIREHIERETQDNIDRGMSRDEARRQAMSRFGNVALITEDTRAVWGWSSLDAIRQDFRYACRTLRKNPTFATVVVLTLGFGIGINTATFSIVNAALSRPLGFAQSERLMALHEHLAGFGLEGDPFSAPDFIDLERDRQSFDGVAAYRNQFAELSGSAEPIRIVAAKVSANLFPLLGVTPFLGRGFTTEEDRPGKLPKLLLHSGRAVRLVRREVCQRPERDVGQRVNELLERQHSSRQPFALIVGSVNGDPLVHHLLPLCVPGKIAGSLVRASPVANANVIVKTPKGFERYLAGNAHVTLGVEMHRTAIGHDLAATLRRWRIDDGPPIRIAEELQRHLIPPFVERLALGGLSGCPLRVIGALEFMIARGHPGTTRRWLAGGCRPARA